jgi:hypothetical protein
MNLDDVPLWQGDHVNTQQLWSYFAQYLYLPRLRDRSVLARAIEDGVSSLNWEQETFAYAAAFDESSSRYAGLVVREHASVLIDSASLVVQQEAARRQFDEEAAPAEVPEEEGGEDGAGPPPPTPPPEAKVRRFYGVKSLDPQRVARDAGDIADEVVKHLVALVDANVEVKLEVSADVPSGVPDEVVRTVTENTKTLKFDQHGFEEQ